MLSLLLIVTGAPRIQVVPRIFDAGQMYEVDTVFAQFVIKNVGDKDLKIKRLRQTCMCTILKDVKKILKPGESDTLKVSVILYGFVGSIMKPVYIYSNDPENPIIKVAVKAFVLETIALPLPVYSPDKIDLGELVVGERRHFTVWVENKGEPDLVIPEIDKPSGIKLLSKLPIVISRNKKKPVEFLFNSTETDTGAYTGNIVFRSNYRRKFKHNIPVYARIIEPGIIIHSPLFYSIGDSLISILFKNTGNKSYWLKMYGEKEEIKPGKVKAIIIERKKVNKRLKITIEIPLDETGKD